MGRQPFAFTIIGIDAVMGRLQQGVGVEFKGQAWVARTHQAMVGEFVLVAQMAGQTQRGARHRLFSANHAGLDVVLAASLAGDMLAQPLGGWPMAGLAAHAVGQLEAFAAYLCRHEGGVTAEAFGRRGGVFQTQLMGDALALVFDQYTVGLGMGIVAMPAQKFGLTDARVANWMASTVAGGTCAGDDTKILGRTRGAFLGPQHALRQTQ